MAGKPEKKQKENPVRCTREGEKEIREGYRKDKTGTICKFLLRKEDLSLCLSLYAHNTSTVIAKEVFSEKRGFKSLQTESQIELVQ